MGYINASNLLSIININVGMLRERHFLQRSFHRTNYGASEPIIRCANTFDDIARTFDFNLSRSSFPNAIKNLL